MVKVKPFAALRPPKALVEEVEARPYDVLSSVEAKAEAGQKSLLHITKPEIDFSPIADEHAPEVYDKAVENFRLWQEKGWLVRDEKPCYYLYAQTMGGRTQYGITLCAHTDDYANGIIKKHELTRKEKEDDRMKHVLIQRANIEPVFFAFEDNASLSAIISDVAAREPEYDFVAPQDGFGHKFWVIDDDALIARITKIFETEVPAFYVADGHHRTAAAARVGAHLREQETGGQCGKGAKCGDEDVCAGEPEYNYFMAVCFPASELKIIDYNRVVKDLNGLSKEQFLKALENDFEVKVIENACAPEGDYRAPGALHSFSCYVDGKWYSMKAKSGRYDDNDPIGCLDVTILSNLVLDRILGIKDLRTDKRIDFVGGIRGLGELEKRVDSGEMAVAFAMYPVSMKQLINIADTGNIMPPKTTWFEPKLRSGLVIHTF
ncbi:MAG: DUF1015 domain-containing protein [Bacteroidales bacterium]|nr:DUF1015 domain-containing protein [Bacteroidales bacterium]